MGDGGFLLRHASGHLPGQSEIDVPLTARLKDFGAVRAPHLLEVQRNARDAPVSRRGPIRG